MFSEESFRHGAAAGIPGAYEENGRSPGRALELLCAEVTFAQHREPLSLELNDRRCPLQFHRPPVEDAVDPALEIGPDLFGVERRGAAGGVGAGGEDRAGELFQEGPGYGGVRHSEARGLPGARLTGWQNDRQGPGPEALHQASGGYRQLVTAAYRLL